MTLKLSSLSYPGCHEIEVRYGLYLIFTFALKIYRFWHKKIPCVKNVFSRKFLGKFRSGQIILYAIRGRWRNLKIASCMIFDVLQRYIVGFCPEFFRGFIAELIQPVHQTYTAWDYTQKIERVEIYKSVQLVLTFVIFWSRSEFFSIFGTRKNRVFSPTFYNSSEFFHEISCTSTRH